MSGNDRYWVEDVDILGFFRNEYLQASRNGLVYGIDEDGFEF